MFIFKTKQKHNSVDLLLEANSKVRLWVLSLQIKNSKADTANMAKNMEM
jgi:hypothetical protein